MRVVETPEGSDRPMVACNAMSFQGTHTDQYGRQCYDLVYEFQNDGSEGDRETALRMREALRDAFRRPLVPVTGDVVVWVDSEEEEGDVEVWEEEGEREEGSDTGLLPKVDSGLGVMLDSGANEATTDGGSVKRNVAQEEESKGRKQTSGSKRAKVD